MIPKYKKIQWVVELLIAQSPGKLVSRTIAESCGWRRDDVDYAIYDLVQEGKVKINSDSTLSVVSP